jgi:branched-chain amino acid transport system permease protein
MATSSAAQRAGAAGTQLQRAREPLAIAAIVLALAAAPMLAAVSGDPYLLKLATRIVIYGLAAAALDLALGVAGLISFGHAAFLGLGAYTVGIAFQHGFEGSTVLGLPPPESALVRLPLAMLAAGAYGLLTGLVALRTRGVAFIMITLAFGQMAYFLFLSLKPYGGQDGIALWTRSAGGPIDLEDQTSFYWLCLGILLAYLLLARRMLRASFGRALRAARDEERRAEALGFPVFRHRLAAYTISAAVTGLAGALLADAIYFVGPSFLGWQTSGELIVMAVLGGLGSIIGPVLGAAAFILLEEVSPLLLNRLGQGVGEHWKLLLGMVLLAMALSSRQGIWGWLVGRGARP